MVTRIGDRNASNPNDVLEGTDSPDFLPGLSFSDTLYGLAGDDILDGGTNPPGFVSFDFLDGGDGVDTVRIVALRDDGTHEFAALNFFLSGGMWVLNSLTPGGRQPEVQVCRRAGLPRRGR